MDCEREVEMDFICVVGLLVDGVFLGYLIGLIVMGD